MTPSTADYCHSLGHTTAPLTEATGHARLHTLPQPLSSGHTSVFQALRPLCPPCPAGWTDAVPSAGSTISWLTRTFSL